LKSSGPHWALFCPVMIMAKPIHTGLGLGFGPMNKPIKSIIFSLAQWWDVGLDLGLALWTSPLSHHILTRAMVGRNISKPCTNHQAPINYLLVHVTVKITCKRWATELQTLIKRDNNSSNLTKIL